MKGGVVDHFCREEHVAYIIYVVEHKCCLLHIKNGGNVMKDENNYAVSNNLS